MVEDSKCKTEFTYHLGFFYYRHMPFGLNNSLDMFQCLMNKLFCGDECI